MTLLTVDEIVNLHDKLIIKTGGLNGLRDIGLLESAVFNSYSEFDGIESYPTIEEKAARLAYSIVNNHAFIDGNKRIGILIMLMTLKLNNINLTYSQQELIYAGLSLADGRYQYDDILEWILNHKL